MENNMSEDYWCIMPFNNERFEIPRKPWRAKIRRQESGGIYAESWGIDHTAFIGCDDNFYNIHFESRVVFETRQEANQQYVILMRKCLDRMEKALEEFERHHCTF